jgi:hypothetical protein
MIWKRPDHPTSYPQWNFSTNLPAEAALTPVARLCHSASLSKGWDLIDRYGNDPSTGSVITRRNSRGPKMADLASQNSSTLFALITCMTSTRVEVVEVLISDLEHNTLSHTTPRSQTR